MNGIRFTIFAYLFTLFAALAAPGTSAAESKVAVVVSADWEIEDVSLRDLRKTFLENGKRLAGKKAVPIDSDGASSIYRAFVDRVIQMSRPAFEDYWLEQALSGGVRPPRQIDAPERRLSYVARNVGAIAYVDLDDLPAQTDSVRVLKIDGKDPSDPAYPLVR